MESESPPSRTTATLLGSFLRGRPRNTSTSERERELSPSPSNPPSTAQQSARGRRQQHTAANSNLNTLQPSASQPQPASSSNVSGLGLSNMLRRRRSAGNVAQQQQQQAQQQQAQQQQASQQQHPHPHPQPPAMPSHSSTTQNVLALATGMANPILPGRPNLVSAASDPAHAHVSSSNHNPNGATHPSIHAGPNGASAAALTSDTHPGPTASIGGSGINPHPNPHAPNHRIRLVPHIDSRRSLRFDPISRSMREGDPAIRIGRFTDRSGLGLAAVNSPTSNKLAFRSKVVSRAHAELWVEPGGKFFIRDTKSSSGTFLNHVRLSGANVESRPFQIKDGDVLQLGVDYQGGTEDVYKSVKIRIEIGREWQSGANAFNTTAFKNLKALTAPSHTTANGKSKLGVPDCCICLFTISIRQALFTAPCSHTFHYKCIRPILESHHPAFSCPLCRTFADLEEDVEMDDAEFVRDDTSSNDQVQIKIDEPDRNNAGAVPITALARGTDVDGADNRMDVDQDEQANNQTEVEDQQPQPRVPGFGTRRRGPSVLPEVDEPGPDDDVSDDNANSSGNVNASASLARISPSPENDVDLDHARSCRQTLFNPSVVQRIDGVPAVDGGYIYSSTTSMPLPIPGLHSLSSDNNVDNSYADPSTVGSQAMLGMGINANSNAGPGSSAVPLATRGRSESPFGGGVFGTTLGRPVEK